MLYWMSVPALWALTWRERFSRLPKTLASLCCPSRTDPPCGENDLRTCRHTLNIPVVRSKKSIQRVTLRLQEVPHPPAAVRRWGRLALRAAGHGDAPLPHRGEAAAGGPAGWHSRDAASPQRALQNPGRRLCPENKWGLTGGGSEGPQKGEKEEKWGVSKEWKEICRGGGCWSQGKLSAGLDSKQRKLGLLLYSQKFQI